jgi:hypothetical protein
MSQLCGMLKNPAITWKSNLTGHFSPLIPPFANGGLSRRLTWIASGDERGTKSGVNHKKPRMAEVLGGISAGPTDRRRRRTDTLHADVCIFVIISLNPSWNCICCRSRRENQNTHFMLNYSFPENRVVCDRMREHTVQHDRPQ